MSEAGSSPASGPGLSDGRDSLLASTAADGTLILTPCGPLYTSLGGTLLHAAAAAVSAGIGKITVDLGRVPAHSAGGVRAVRGCRRLAESSGTVIRFLTRGGDGQALLLASLEETASGRGA